MKREMVGVAVVSVLATGIACAENEKAEEAAVAAAEAWLKLVDEGKYTDSRQETAACFEHAVDKEQWGRSLQAVRRPFGKLVSKEIKSQSHKTALPGAPDGQYVAIQFETSFENKKSAIETVTPMMDQDGNWRLSACYIK